MATHSSVLTWKILWTEEPSRLQSVGSQRVGHTWATEHTHIHNKQAHTYNMTKLSQVTRGFPSGRRLTWWRICMHCRRCRFYPWVGKKEICGEGNGNPRQYSCLGNPVDRGAWRATVHGVTGVRQDLVTKQQQHQLRQRQSRLEGLVNQTRSHASVSVHDCGTQWSLLVTL